MSENRAPIPLNRIAEGAGIFGASGSGKTHLIFWLVQQLIALGVTVRFWDFKGEASRLPFCFEQAMVFNIQNAPWHWLEPIGDNLLAYFTSIISDIRLEFELRPETFPLLWQIAERIIRGMRPGDPWPSWEDWCRIIEHEAVVQKRENLYTAARVFRNICVALDPNARVRRVPDITGRYKVIGYDFVGVDPALFRLFLGFHFNRLILKAQHEGHTTDLSAVDIIDEGSLVFSTELLTRGVGHISAAKRFASMARFTGTGLIVGGQNVSQIDSFLKQNLATIAVFRTPSVADAEEAAAMLGLPRTSVPELMQLETGYAFMRSIGWQKPVKIHVPELPLK